MASEMAGQNEMLGEPSLPRLKHDILLKERLTEGVIFDSELVVTDDANDLNNLSADGLSAIQASDLFDDESLVQTEQQLSSGQLNQHVHDRWSDPIVFHPNGRAENREVTLHSDDGYSITLSLCGFTGTATIGRPEKTVRPKPGDQPTFSKVNSNET